MNVLVWLVFGLIAGSVAKAIMPGRDPGGCLATSAIGVAGAFLGGFIGTRLGWGGLSGFDLRSLGLAVLGAVLLLVAYRLVFRRSQDAERY